MIPIACAVVYVILLRVEWSTLLRARNGQLREIGPCRIDDETVIYDGHGISDLIVKSIYVIPRNETMMANERCTRAVGKLLRALQGVLTLESEK